jgi:hypothetical protein
VYLVLYCKNKTTAPLCTVLFYSLEQRRPEQGTVRADPHRILSSSVSGFQLASFNASPMLLACLLLLPLASASGAFPIFALLSLRGNGGSKRATRKRRHGELASRWFGSWRRRWSVYY